MHPLASSFLHSIHWQVPLTLAGTAQCIVSRLNTHRHTHTHNDDSEQVKPSSHVSSSLKKNNPKLWPSFMFACEGAYLRVVFVVVLFQSTVSLYCTEREREPWRGSIQEIRKKKESQPLFSTAVLSRTDEKECILCRRGFDRKRGKIVSMGRFENKRRKKSSRLSFIPYTQTNFFLVGFTLFVSLSLIFFFVLNAFLSSRFFFHLVLDIFSRVYRTNPPEIQKALSLLFLYFSPFYFCFLRPPPPSKKRREKKFIGSTAFLHAKKSMLPKNHQIEIDLFLYCPMIEPLRELLKVGTTNRVCLCVASRKESKVEKRSGRTVVWGLEIRIVKEKDGGSLINDRIDGVDIVFSSRPSRTTTSCCRWKRVVRDKKQLVTILDCRRTTKKNCRIRRWRQANWILSPASPPPLLPLVA